RILLRFALDRQWWRRRISEGYRKGGEYTRKRLGRAGRLADRAQVSKGICSGGGTAGTDARRALPLALLFAGIVAERKGQVSGISIYREWRDSLWLGEAIGPPSKNRTYGNTDRLCIRNSTRHCHCGGRSWIYRRCGRHGCAHKRTNTRFTQPRFDRFGCVAAELDTSDQRIGLM